MSNLDPNLTCTESHDVLCQTIVHSITPGVKDLSGLTVRRILPYAKQQMVGPWIFCDHMGPVSFNQGEGVDVRPHPHINLATVTYLFEGEILHRDNLGYVQSITPGAINLMVAGKGIVHSERTPIENRNTPHKLHGMQCWLALPETEEEIDPAFYHYPAQSLPQLKENGVEMRVLIGSGYGVSSPVKTFSPTFYAEAIIDKGATLTLPKHIVERAIYIVDGSLITNETTLAAETMSIFTQDLDITLTAAVSTHCIILGGSPVGKRHIWWNFVSSSKDRIEQAKLDWQAQKFVPIPGDNEYIPLPD